MKLVQMLEKFWWFGFMYEKLKSYAYNLLTWSFHFNIRNVKGFQTYLMRYNNVTKF